MKKIWCVIPVYNNAMTVHTVVRQCLRELPDVLVVDDGSTDTDLAAFYASSRVTVLRNETNRGKGAAIRRAAEYLASLGADYMITLDADGQHFPEDIRTFLPLIEANEHAVIVGCRDFNTENVPESSRFGRSFANFWMRVETGVPVDDCQSGFRAYPVKYIVQLNCISDRYGYETELLTRSAWAGLDILCVPVRVCYPPQGKRISHFRPWLDNFRLSCLHTHPAVSEEETGEKRGAAFDLPPERAVYGSAERECHAGGTRLLGGGRDFSCSTADSRFSYRGDRLFHPAFSSEQDYGASDPAPFHAAAVAVSLH